VELAWFLSRGTRRLALLGFDLALDLRFTTSLLFQNLGITFRCHYTIDDPRGFLLFAVLQSYLRTAPNNIGLRVTLLCFRIGTTVELAALPSWQRGCNFTS
jgi:hypothetical protein